MANAEINTAFKYAYNTIVSTEVCDSYVVSADALTRHSPRQLYAVGDQIQIEIKVIAQQTPSHLRLFESAADVEDFILAFNKKIGPKMSMAITVRSVLLTDKPSSSPSVTPSASPSAAPSAAPSC